jgi:hypothetical protein
MHDIKTVAIWFLLVNAGMILTMLLPWMALKSRHSEAKQVKRKPIPTDNRLHQRAA